MTDELKDQTVLVIGRGSGIARAITETVRDAGATVIVAGRDKDKLAAAYEGDAGITAEYVDLTDEASIAALADRISVDHIVSTGSARARGKADYFADVAARNPVRRIGTVEDIASAVRFALTNTFLTGQTLHVDGGEPLT